MIAGELREFLGASAIVGQHVAFDLMYLRRLGMVPPGPVFNTAEIAELLFPGLQEYSLRSLTTRFGIDFPIQHRALPDAEAAMQVFLHLRDGALNLDGLILKEIVQLTSACEWPLRFFFREVEHAAPLPLSAGYA